MRLPDGMRKRIGAIVYLGLPMFLDNVFGPPRDPYGPPVIKKNIADLGEWPTEPSALDLAPSWDSMCSPKNLK